MCVKNNVFINYTFGNTHNGVIKMSEKLDILNGLTEEQLLAVKHMGKTLLLVACPGAGKTRTLLARLYTKSMEDALVSSIRKTAVITFTKASAKEMSERYENIINKEKKNYQMGKSFFGTFHSFFYKLLKEYGLYYKIIDEGKKEEIIKRILFKKALGSLSIKEVLDKLDREECKSSVINEIIEDYNLYKKKYKLLDFKDIEEEFIRRLSEDNDFKKFCREKYEYYYVDEFQDCNELQINALKILTKGKSLFAVGDEDQCIYSFRGARPDIMINFHKEFCGGEKLYLTRNFRCGTVIVENSGVLISHNKFRNSKEMVKARQNIGNIEFVQLQDNKNYLNSLEEIILNLKEGILDTAILYRTNKEEEIINDYFLSKGIPFRHPKEYFNLFEYFIVKDIGSYIKLAEDNFLIEEGLNIINKPLRKITPIEIHKILNCSYKNSFINLLLENAKEVSQYKKIKGLEYGLQYLKDKNPYQQIKCIYNFLGYKGYLKELSHNNTIHFNIYHKIIMELLKIAKDSKDYNEVMYKFQRLHQGEEGVVLSTIHGVKGMEFKNVIIVNCNEGYIPYKLCNENEMEEERRLFYVGCTRSIDRLFLLYKRDVKVSRFIMEMPKFKE